MDLAVSRDSASAKTKVLDKKRKKIAKHLADFKGPLERFVTEDWSRDLWRKDDIQKIFPEFTPSQVAEVLRRYPVILAILTCIVWPFDSATFAANFLNRTEDPITDENLPYEGDLDFLGDHAYQFSEYQLTFKPCIVMTESLKTIVYSANRPWAFTDLESLSQGSGGEIYKATVEKNYFTNDQGFVNPEPKVLAYKKFHKAADPEVDNQAYLRESINAHSHVQLHLAAILRGDDFYIFLPWTPLGDLEVLLHGGHDPAAETTTLGTTKYTFEEQFGSVTEIHFVDQLRKLADALKYLHYDLVFNDTSAHHFYCAHNDLRPRNILVYPDENSCIGKWMITDFGISSFGGSGDTESGPQRFDYPTVGNLARGEHGGFVKRIGTHFAPELHPSSHRRPDPRSCDVWSFGCICTDVLAFVVGGLDHDLESGIAVKEAVAYLRRFRKQKTGEDDYFYQYPDGEVQYAGKQTDALVRPEVQQWLSDLDNRFRVQQPLKHEWVLRMTNLIRQILVIDPLRRLDAREVNRELESIPRAMQPPSWPGPLTRTQTRQEPTSAMRSSISLTTQQTDTSEMSTGSRSEIAFRVNSPSLVRSPQQIPLTTHATVPPEDPRSLETGDGNVYTDTPLSIRTTNGSKSSNSELIINNTSGSSTGNGSSMSESSSVIRSIQTHIKDRKVVGLEHRHSRCFAISPGADKLAYLIPDTRNSKRWCVKVHDVRDLSQTDHSIGSTLLPSLSSDVCWENKWTKMKIAGQFVTVSGLSKDEFRHSYFISLNDSKWMKPVLAHDEDCLHDIIPSVSGNYAFVFKNKILLQEHISGKTRKLFRQRSNLYEVCFTNNGRFLICWWWWCPGRNEVINHEIWFWDTHDPENKIDKHFFSVDAKRNEKPSLLPASSLPACMFRLEESQPYQYLRASFGDPGLSTQAFTIPRGPVYDSLPTACGDSWRFSIVPKPRPPRRIRWQSEYEIRKVRHGANGKFEDAQGEPLENFSLPSNTYQMAVAELASTTRLVLANNQGDLIEINMFVDQEPVAIGHESGVGSMI